MADKIFKIDLWPKDWLLDTSILAPDVRGNYIQILCLIYAKGGAIEPDYKWIAGNCGCSPRLVRSHVDELVDKNFLIKKSDGKISQKRAELELNLKRTHLEHAANGGRKSAEIKSVVNKNKDLTLSGEASPLPTTLSSPIQSKGILDNTLPESGTAARAEQPDEDGIFFQEFSGSDRKGGGSIGIIGLLFPHELEAVRQAAPGWDIVALATRWEAGVERRGLPKYPAKAFLGWVKKTTKGQPPC